MHSALSLSAILATIALAACDSGVTSPGGTKTLPEPVIAGGYVDGTIRYDGQNVNILLSPGDDANGSSYRAVVGFDLSSLPTGAHVTAAVLKVEQCEVFGAPYMALGPLIVDHVDLSAGLTGDAYSSLTLASNVGVISADATLGAKSLDVTSQVVADLSASRHVSGYRMRFTSDANFDQISDGVTLGLARDGMPCSVNHDPALTVTYTR